MATSGPIQPTNSTPHVNPIPAPQPQQTHQKECFQYVLMTALAGQIKNSDAMQKTSIASVQADSVLVSLSTGLQHSSSFTSCYHALENARDSLTARLENLKNEINVAVTSQDPAVRSTLPALIEKAGLTEKSFSWVNAQIATVDAVHKEIASDQRAMRSVQYKWNEAQAMSRLGYTEHIPNVSQEDAAEQKKIDTQTRIGLNDLTHLAGESANKSHNTMTTDFNNLRAEGINTEMMQNIIDSLAKLNANESP